ncbi:helix-turn-helix domain-containing protein [Streptomyces rochei]|uniref:helix-turn-helix domain-containing protein n=2 Tax=Actinomycetota TaxID=201174 RepID=UPI0035E2048E
MDEATKRLGTELQAAREGRRPRLTQPQVAEHLGVSRTTIQNIEAGRFQRVNANIRDYARLLGWPEGAAERVMEGGTVRPPDEPPATAEPSAPAALGLSPAVEMELQAGETLESNVINLGPDEDDGHIIVVLQSRKGATREEMARVAARYRKARRYLQSIASETDEVAEP